MKQFIILVLSTILLASCSKETVDVELTHNNKALTKSGKIVLGTDNITKRPIVAKFNIKVAPAGKHGIEFEHVNYIALSQDGHYVEFNATINRDSELVILGDIISIGFEDGECDWCDCMNDAADMVMNDASGGWALVAAAALCPECVVGIAAGVAIGCGIGTIAQN